jgi:hypothetical protein
MKKLGFTIFAAAVLALPIGAQSPAAAADVPFGFVAGNTTMPAGKYTVEISTSASASVKVALVDADGHTRLLNTIPGDARSTPGRSVLVFHLYGDQYFLSEIRTPSKSREIPATLAQREAEKTASAGRAGQEIVLAMR